ncbi:MAG: hypothetical protein ABJB16_07695, partial [Saprospiraceae bacterium]
MKLSLCIFFLSIACLISFISCDQTLSIAQRHGSTSFYSTSKPCTRWWWFATQINKKDIKYQLDWMKEMNFGGVEIAWIYPLYRYQKMY